MLRYDWSRADPLAKWAATLFLGTIGVGYLFGIWMVVTWVGMWLTKYTSPGFAWMTLAGGWLMALGYVAIAGSALWRMWVRPRRT